LNSIEDVSLARRTFEGLGKALGFTNRTEESVSIFKRMREFAVSWGDVPMQVSALNKLAFVKALRMHQFEEARELLLEAEQLARTFGDGRGLVELATLKCAMCLPTGSFTDAVNTLGDSISIAGSAPDMRQELATALSHLALTMTYSTRFDDAWQAALEARRVAEEIGNRELIGELLTFPIPMYLLRNGDVDAALAAAKEGIDVATRVGDFFHMANGSVVMAGLHLVRGEYKQARDVVSPIVGIGLQFGDYAPFVLPMALGELLSASMGIGKAEYEQALHEHADLLQAMEPYLDATACAELGFCALAEGDLERADAFFQRGINTPSGSWLLERPRLLAGAATVKLAAADVVTAQALIDEGRAFATERGMRHMYALLDRVEADIAARDQVHTGEGR
jgi:tetratricopeptide (TPR) repeat protein